MSRILGLTPAQEGILHIVFRIADNRGLLLIDLKDLRAMLTYVNEHRSEYMMTYGNITSQSGAVRESAGGRRSGQAQAGVLLR